MSSFQKLQTSKRNSQKAFSPVAMTQIKYAQREDNQLSKNITSPLGNRSVEVDGREKGSVQVVREEGRSVPFFIKENLVQSKKLNLSPKPIKSSQIVPVSPMRSTLKALVQKTGAFDRSIPQKRPVTRPTQFSNQEQIYQSRSMKILQQQNDILREQNQLLKYQLSQIKRTLMHQKPSKKQDIINNLRHTIKKQEGAIQQLKMRLEMTSNKNQSLLKVIQSKDEEIGLWSSKVQSLERQFDMSRGGGGGQKMQGMRERINGIVRSFNQLEIKYEKSQLEWQQFKEEWTEEKSIYMHRIQFLESYISNTH